MKELCQKAIEIMKDNNNIKKVKIPVTVVKSDIMLKFLDLWRSAWIVLRCTRAIPLWKQVS